MKFIKYLLEKRRALLITFLVVSTVAIVNITLHDDKPTEFFLMVWTGIGIAALAYTYYEFKNLDKNDWI